MKVEKRALQLLLNGPWNAIPDGLLRNLIVLDFSVQAQSLMTLSAASRVRDASNTSTTVWDLTAKTYLL